VEAMANLVGGGTPVVAPETSTCSPGVSWRPAKLSPIDGLPLLTRTSRRRLCHEPFAFEELSQALGQPQAGH